MKDILFKVLMLKGDAGNPTDEQTMSAVSEWLSESGSTLVVPWMDTNGAGAVGEWLDDHPEATTSVLDGSLTEPKFSDALKLKTIKDYVTPEMFGAVGDGEADDTTAINSAIAKSIEDDCALVFLSGKSYKTTEPIVIENPPKSIIMKGSLIYTGSGVALTIGKSGAYVTNVDLELNIIGNTLDSAYTQASTGAKLINVFNSFIKLSYIERFETGVEMLADGNGFAYNSVLIGQLVSCLTLLKLNSSNLGWINENKFFGGRFQVYSADSFKSQSVGILLTSDSYYNNSNIFYAPCLEQLGTCVKIEYGQFNRFYDCRTEGVQRANVFVTSNKSYWNTFTTSYGVSSTDTSFASANRLENVNDRIIDAFSSVIFDSGDISANCAKNASRISFSKLMRSNYGTFEPYLETSDGDMDSDGVIVKTNGNIGVLIDTVKNKTFMLSAVAKGTYRQGVRMYDADGNRLQIAPTAYTVYGSSAETMQATGGMLGGYAIGANVDVDVYITVPDECVKAFFCLYGQGSSFTLERFVIKARNYERLYLLSNADSAILQSIPTSAGKVGQMVKNASPTSGNIGWVYNGTSWIAFG